MHLGSSISVQGQTFVAVALTTIAEDLGDFLCRFCTANRERALKFIRICSWVGSAYLRIAAIQQKSIGLFDPG